MFKEYFGKAFANCIPSPTVKESKKQHNCTDHHRWRMKLQCEGEDVIAIFIGAIFRGRIICTGKLG